MYIRRGHKDYLNPSHTRNVRNTPITDYNCGGYALGTFSWYRPALKLMDWGDECVSLTPTEVEETYKHCIETILTDFPTMRVIRKVKDLRANEYAIAFRLGGIDGVDDFHFIKRARNGQWYHKRGALAPERISKDKIFEPVWYNSGWLYRGKIILFAKEI